MTNRYSLSVILVCLVFVSVSSAQKPTTQAKRGPAKTTSAASGQEMFLQYCASCHGTDGKGEGPAAGSLKNRPADLTTLTKTNGGDYPAQKVATILLGKYAVTPHGNAEMPVWGPVFRAISHGDEAEVQLRIKNLNDYLKSIQVYSLPRPR